MSETPWTVAHQASPAKGFSGQEYQSGETAPKKLDHLTYEYQCKKKKILKSIRTNRIQQHTKRAIHYDTNVIYSMKTGLFQKQCVNKFKHINVIMVYST